MEELLTCSRCSSLKLPESFKIKKTTGERCKTCDSCREKTRQCPQCERKCCSVSDLARHIKTHGSKDQKCSYADCQFQSHRPLVIQQHIKTVHEQIKDFGCPRCDYKCGDTSNIVRHMKTCTGGVTMSSGEFAVKGILDAMGIQHQRQMRFIDCKDINVLPFDFYLPQQMAIIEYDGKQHFEPVKHWGGQEVLEITQQHDAIKNAYCATKNIRLLRIKYTDFERIQELITAFLA